MEMLDVSGTEIGGLLVRVETADGHPGFSEYKEVRLGAPDARTAAWGSGGRALVAAVAAARDGAAGRHWSLEVAVDPDVRSEGVERDALSAAAALVPSGERHSLWAWREPQLRAARDLGYGEVRRLLRMEGVLREMAAAATPANVGIDAIDLDRDVAGVIAVNNRAFAGHREAGKMDRASLDDLMRRPWYDPNGLLVARSAGRVTGFCWTKQHPGAVGEIYIVAVDPVWTGRGLGRALVAAGFGSLAGRGARRGMLWVDEKNKGAVELYRALGLVTTFVNRELEPTRP